MIEFFGEPWGDRIIDGGRRIRTPVGTPCLHCDETISQIDQGIIMTASGKDANGISLTTEKPVHRECRLLMAFGSVAHMEKRCSCYRPITDCMSEDTYPSRRDEARTVALWLANHHQKV